MFLLFADGPKDWDINFKPAYDNKYISSLRIKANRKETMAIEVKPSMTAQADEYTIKVRVSSSEAKGEAELKAVIMGTYGIEVGTSTGLLSLDACQGKAANISFYIKNSGSAVNKDIKFTTFKPENWKVEFKPEKIASIEPGELKQLSISRFSGPLPLGQSILVVLPYIVSLFAITVICFAVSYMVFSQKEIRLL